jgi:hypothetical protein
LGSNVSPSCVLRNGRPTKNRFDRSPSDGTRQAYGSAFDLLRSV